MHALDEALRAEGMLTHATFFALKSRKNRSPFFMAVLEHRPMKRGFYMSLLRDRMSRDLERAGLAPRTRKHYIAAIARMIQFLGRSPEQLTPDDIRHWEDEMRRRAFGSNWTRIHLAALKFLFNKTIYRPEMVSFISYPRTARKIPSVLSVDEVGRVLASFHKLRYLTFFSLLFDTGLRIEEAVMLKAGDIDYARHVIIVRHGKGARQRQVKLGEKLYALLRAYWREVRMKEPLTEPLSKDSLLFVGQGGKPFSLNGARQALALAVKKAGIAKRVTPHTFRHSFATAQLEAGTDVRVTQLQLGHACIGSTQRYLHVSTRLILQAPSPLDILG
jgi:site-specific recombinase XerD